MNFNENDVRIVLKDRCKSKNIYINLIGNQKIGRHRVYKIYDGKKEYIFKTYYVKDKRFREINSLNLLKEGIVNVPKILDFGEYKGYEWILISYIDGIILETALDNLTEKNKLDIFNELGQALGKIHSFKTFSYGGEWNLDYCSFKKYKITKFEERVREIESQNLKEKDSLYKAIDIIKENYNCIFDIDEFRLTHNDFDGRNVLVKREKNIYRISGIIDFEQTCPDNYENDLGNLYLKYFYKNKEYEKAFIQGYNVYMKLNKNFKNKLNLYLLLMVIEHCSWSYEKAREYYDENIEFLKEILFEEN